MIELIPIEIKEIKKYLLNSPVYILVCTSLLKYSPAIIRLKKWRKPATTINNVIGMIENSILFFGDIRLIIKGVIIKNAIAILISYVKE